MPKYRFFAQQQINTATNAVLGYELLIKELTPDGWRLPSSFIDIDTKVFANLLIETTKILGQKVRYCSVNVNRDQLMNTDIAEAIIESQRQLYPTKLIVELTEDVSEREYTPTEIKEQLERFVSKGIQISLDDVGTGHNQFEDIEDFLPLASEIKFAVQNFKSTIQDPKIKQKVRFWNAISSEYNIQLVLEGIEDQADNQLSQSFGISRRQGYFFSKPQLLSLPGDK
ncbi:EAL domain-containing protein [Pediococcus pentosaceus]|uniref:EAL domain-containing protein n=1 Tax=Pediococcus pentosaceus TaxID=1255 RepID=UPI003F830902